MTPLFLDIDDVLEIHRDQIERYCGSPGLRDEGLLRSAVGMPSSGIAGEFFHPTLHEMAAAYLYHLVQNHPFVDGNRRVAAATAYVFLHINGAELSCSEDAFESLVRRAASGAATKQEIAEFLRVESRPIASLDQE